MTLSQVNLVKYNELIYLGGGFISLKDIFTPILGEMIQLDIRIIFHKWVEPQPPTTSSYFVLLTLESKSPQLT